MLVNLTYLDHVFRVKKSIGFYHSKMHSDLSGLNLIIKSQKGQFFDVLKNFHVRSTGHPKNIHFNFKQ
jgi:hypothetical protein